MQLARSNAVWLKKTIMDYNQPCMPMDDEAAAEYHIAYAEADRLGAVAETAKFRMLLIIDDAELSQLADAAGGHVGAVIAARDKTEIEKLDAEFEAHMAMFLGAAARLLKSDR